MRVVDQQSGEDITDKVKAERDAGRSDRDGEPRREREDNGGGRHRGERRRESAGE
jgi:polyribonucleotide nucleotidyltransferase